jgi:poly-gamma-glutamate capsule biosynthesis protein CapA/YwtB (metallophosphatase superfamily)
MRPATVVLFAMLGPLGLCACRASDADRAASSAEATPTTTTTVDLWLGGDVHLGARDEDRLAVLAAEFEGALGVINLEGPVAEGPSDRERLRNSAGGLAWLARRGVAVAGVANNHALDLGLDGVAHTRAALGAVGIAAAGRNPGETTGARWVLVEQHGLDIAVVAYDLSLSTAHTDGDMDARHAAELRRAVEGAAAQAPVVVVTLHVKGVPSYLPTRELQQAVSVAVDAGARIVAAHGTHALARVERRAGAVIAWGLGNLIFECECTSERDGLIVRVRASRHALERVEVIPVDAGLHGAPATLAGEAGLTLDLLESLGTVFTERSHDRARL